MTLFRANTLFRNFEIKGPADRVLIYGILFVSDCLGRIKPNMSLRDSEKVRFVWEWGGFLSFFFLMSFRTFAIPDPNGFSIGLTDGCIRLLRAPRGPCFSVKRPLSAA